MQVQLQIEGGFAYLPALNKPVTVNSDTLPTQEQAELERLVNASNFFALPAALNAPARGAADHRQYTLTIIDGIRKHTVHATEPIKDARLQSLVNFVQKHR